VLKHGGNSPVVRMQAGLQLKNALYSKEPTLQQQYKQRWLLIPEESYRAYIKKNVSVTSPIFAAVHNLHAKLGLYLQV
jgi:importin subunit beta-1